MRFSLIIPAYNAESFLERTFHCVEYQTYKDFEVIFVDDGSVDGTASMLDDFVARHCNATVIHQENSGPLIARRAAASIASGEYLMFMDADDALRSDAIEICAHVAASSSPGIISFRYSDRPDFSVASDLVDIEPGVYVGNKYSLVKELTCSGRFNELWNKAVRADLFDIHADYSPYSGMKHGEDWFQLLPIIDAATSFVRIDEILYHYNRSTQSGTANFQLSQLRDLEPVCLRLKEYAGRWGGSCLSFSLAGEVQQYVYLLKITEASTSPAVEKLDAFRRVRMACYERDVFADASNAPLRLDDRIIISLLERGYMTLCRFAVGATMHISPILKKIVIKSKY